MGATPTVVSLFGRVPRDWQDKLLAQDVIYVGGGNTRSMLALWREWDLDQLLRRALEVGIVLAGVSAGACCWFDECLTDSIFPMGRCDGLGVLAGSVCPHYDSEPERRPTLAALIQSGEIGPGLALDDGAAAHFVDGELRHIVTSRPHAHAYRVRSSEGQFVEELLEGRYLGAESTPDDLRDALRGRHPGNPYTAAAERDQRVGVQHGVPVRCGPRRPRRLEDRARRGRRRRGGCSPR